MWVVGLMSELNESVSACRSCLDRQILSFPADRFDTEDADDELEELLFDLGMLEEGTPQFSNIFISSFDFLLACKVTPKYTLPQAFTLTSTHVSLQKHTPAQALTYTGSQ